MSAFHAVVGGSVHAERSRRDEVSTDQARDRSLGDLLTGRSHSEVAGVLRRCDGRRTAAEPRAGSSPRRAGRAAGSRRAAGGGRAAGAGDATRGDDSARSGDATRRWRAACSSDATSRFAAGAGDTAGRWRAARSGDATGCSAACSGRAAGGWRAACSGDATSCFAARAGDAASRWRAACSGRAAGARYAAAPDEASAAGPERASFAIDRTKEGLGSLASNDGQTKRRQHQQSTHNERLSRRQRGLAKTNCNATPTAIPERRAGMPEKKDASERREGREIGAAGSEFKTVAAADLRR